MPVLVGRAFIVGCGSESPSPQLLMGNPFQGHIETVLVIEAMPANGSNFTVCADQKLDVAHVLGEAHVLKDEHVINQPVLLEEIAFRVAAIGQSWLLSHGGKEKLQWEENIRNTQDELAQSHCHPRSLYTYSAPSSFLKGGKRKKRSPFLRV